MEPQLFGRPLFVEPETADPALRAAWGLPPGGQSPSRLWLPLSFGPPWLRMNQSRLLT